MTSNTATPTTQTPAEVELHFSLFLGCRDNEPKHLRWTWERLISPDGLGKPREVHGATREEAKHTLLAVSPAAYPAGALRGDRNVESIQLFMLDFDNKAEQPTGETKENGEPIFTKVPIVGAPRMDDVSQHLAGLGITHFGYHSFSSTPECERFRIVIPLSRASDGKNWKVVSECLLGMLSMEQWRSLGCLDLGAMHRAACLYFVAGYWSGDPTAKDRIRFVSFEGAPLDLPTQEEVASLIVAPSAIHPLRREWAEKKAAQRAASVTGDPKTWFKAFAVDFPTLDIIGLVREMGSEVQAAVPYQGGFKAQCTCPFAAEHTGGHDNGDAAVFFGADGWPGFHCMHDVHEGVGLRELCLEAGPELVQRHAKPFRVVSAKKAPVVRHNRAEDTEEVQEGEIMDDSDPGRAARERERWTAVLEAHGVDPISMVFTKEGRIAKSRSNLKRILVSDQDFSGAIRYNAMTMMTELKVPEYDYLDLEDLDRNLTALQIYLEDTYGVPFAEDAVNKVSGLVGGGDQYHPVEEYLRRLPRWDGQDRFPLLVESVLAVREAPDFDQYRTLYQEYMRCTLIGAVRRVLEPGVKMDTVTILFGDQAALKSTFWKTMCADPRWFNDSKVQIDSPEGMKILHHAWIHELGEIDEMTSIKSAEQIKAFVSSPSDTFRQSYGKAPQTFHRRSIIVGSTNKEQMLNDPTGSRRFWVIPVGKRCDMDLLRAHLDQIWAQAFHLCQHGVPHWLSPEFEALRVTQSGRHQMENRFADLLPKIQEFYLSAPRPKGITLNEIFSFLEGKLEEGKGFAKPNHADRRDLGACLRAAGWSTKSTWIDKASSKCFTPPEGILGLNTPQAGVGIDGFAFPVPDLSVDPFAGARRGMLI